MDTHVHTETQNNDVGYRFYARNMSYYLLVNKESDLASSQVQ